MYSHGEAEHVDSLLNVSGPVAAFLIRLNLVDDHLVLYLSGWGDIERGAERLARVLGTGKEVNDVSLLLDDTLLHLLRVGYAFPFEDVLPVFGTDLNLILDRGRVFKLCLFRHTDELLDIVPFTFEQRGVVWNRIIGGVRRRHATDDSKLTEMRIPLESVLQVVPRTIKAEKRNNLHIID